MDLKFLDTLIVCTYFILILFVALKPILSQKQTVYSMVTGDCTQSPLQLGLSLSATHLSAIAILGYAGKAYVGNLMPTALAWSTPFVAFFSIRYFAPMFLRNRYFSAFTVLRDQFGVWAGIYGALLFIFIQVSWVSILLISMLKLLDPMMREHLLSVLGLIVVSSTIYTYFGGFKTIVKTDTMQWYCIVLFLIAMLLTVFWKTPLDQAATIVSEKTCFGSFSVDVFNPSVWVFFLMGIMLNFEKFGTDQAFSQRCIALKSESGTRVFAWTAVLSYCILVVLLVSIGLGLMVFYGDLGGEPESETIPILTQFVLREGPVGLTGLFVVGIFAAVMSSLDSAINSTSVVFLENVLNAFAPKSSEDTQLQVMNAISIVFSLAVLAVTYAIYWQNFDIAYIWLDIESVMGASLLGLFLLKLLYSRSSGIAGVTGVLAAILVSSWITFGDVLGRFWKPLSCPITSYMTLPLGVLACVAVGILISYFKPNHIS